MDDIEGLYEVHFTTGIFEWIDIKVNMVNPQAQPLYLIAVDGTIYNWQNIISIKKRG